jgi:hypothetical protein
MYNREEPHPSEVSVTETKHGGFFRADKRQKSLQKPLDRQSRCTVLWIWSLQSDRPRSASKGHPETSDIEEVHLKLGSEEEKGSLK